MQLGNTVLPVKKWNQVPELIANWLLNQGFSLTDLSFIHSSESAFRPSARLKALANGAWIEVGDDRLHLFSKARQLLAGCRQTDVTCIILMADGSRIDLNRPAEVARVSAKGKPAAKDTNLAASTRTKEDCGKAQPKGLKPLPVNERELVEIGGQS